MNVFVIAYRAAGVPADVEHRMSSALGVVTAWVPLPDRETWTSPDGCVAIACAAHAGERIGGVRYWMAEDGDMALFSGRPIAWEGEHAADGAATLDPRFFARPAAKWQEAFDGRAAAARYDAARRAVEILPDPTGMYAVYTRDVHGIRYASNQPRVLEALGGAPGWRADALAGLVGAGWSVSGDAIWEGVERVPRGALETWEPAGVRHDPVLPPVALAGYLAERRFDATAARTLIEEALIASLAWPGRPAIIPLTAGKDSRVVFEAALSRGLPFTSLTLSLCHESGYPETQDLRVARELARERGIEHATDRVLWPGERVGLRLPDGLRLLRALGPGATALNEVQSMLWPVDDGPLRLVAKGFGGEVGRAFYGLCPDAVDPADHLLARMAPRFAPNVLTALGRRLLRERVAERVDAARAVGVEDPDIPDVFYFESRITTWGTAFIGIQEHTEDTVAPMFSRRLLPHLWGCSREDRRSERFHRDVLGTYGVARTASVAAPPGRIPRPVRRATGELWRLARPTRPFSPAQDPLNALRHVARARLDAVERPELWRIVDRRRARLLLGLDASRMDVRARLAMNRLATAIVLAGPA